MIPLILHTNILQKANSYIKMYCKTHDMSYKTLLTVARENQTITIESVRALWSQLQRKYTHQRGIVIYDFETARFDTQNALLKMLEEETERIQFFLITRDTSSILPTILSRSNIISLEQKKIDLFQASFSEIIRTEFGHSDKITKEKALILMDRLIATVRNSMKQNVASKDFKGKKFVSTLHEMLKTRKVLIKNNVNPTMAVDHAIMQLISI